MPDEDAQVQAEPENHIGTGIHEPLDHREDLSRSSVASREAVSNEGQARSDAGQRRTEVTLHDILEAVTSNLSQVEGRMGRIEISMDKLTTASNHRMETFEVWIAKFAEALALKADVAALEKKADKDDLLTSWGERMLRIRFVRWGVGLLAAGVFATAIEQHWFMSVLKFLEQWA